MAKDNKKVEDEDKKKEQCKKLMLIDILKIGLAVIEIICAGTLTMKLFTIENSFNKEIVTLQQNLNSQMTILEEQISNSIEVIKNVDMSSSVENTTINYEALINERTDTETLLRYAENAYLSGDYERVIQIYSLAKMAENPIACNNMGYMFANGIYYPVNIAQADNYYDKAMESGEVKAYYNKLALHFRHKTVDLIEMLKQAYDYDEDKMIEFVSYNLEKCNGESDVAKTEMVKSFLFSMQEVEQANILEQFYYWEEQGSVALDYAAYTTEMVKYVEQSTECFLEGDTVRTVTYYDKYEKKCSGIGLLQEGWIWMK